MLRGGGGGPEVLGPRGSCLGSLGRAPLRPGCSQAPTSPAVLPIQSLGGPRAHCGPDRLCDPPGFLPQTPRCSVTPGFPWLASVSG